MHFHNQQSVTFFVYRVKLWFLLVLSYMGLLEALPPCLLKIFYIFIFYIFIFLYFYIFIFYIFKFLYFYIFIFLYFYIFIFLYFHTYIFYILSHWVNLKKVYFEDKTKIRSVSYCYYKYIITHFLLMLSDLRPPPPPTPLSRPP